MENTTVTEQTYARLKAIGWIISILGTALYLYGYFADGGTPVINWPLYLPEWAAAFVPTWEAELGFALSIVGSLPIYYVEFTKH